MSTFRSAVVHHVKYDTAVPQLPSLVLLQQAPTGVISYQEALKTLIKDFETVIGRCQFSLEGMKYNDTGGQNILVNSTGVFFPAATWLRAFFHDAGTFVKQPPKGGPKGKEVLMHFCNTLPDTHL